MEGLICRAGLGFRARTVPGGALRVCRARPDRCFFLERSLSSLRRMAYMVLCTLTIQNFQHTADDVQNRVVPHRAWTASAGWR